MTLQRRKYEDTEEKGCFTLSAEIKRQGITYAYEGFKEVIERTK